MTTDSNNAGTMILSLAPRVMVPPPEPPTDEELARRRGLLARAKALREAIGPIGIRTDELVRQVREEADGSAD